MIRIATLASTRSPTPEVFVDIFASQVTARGRSSISYRGAVPETPFALVTGASRGIGAAVAHALHPSHRLLLGGRDAEALDKRVSEMPGARSWPVDLTDLDALRRRTAGIDRLDVLVH